MGDLEAIGEPVFPKKLFAFGLGYEKLVHPDIGTFLVKMKKNETYSESLKVVPCSENKENISDMQAYED